MCYMISSRSPMSSGNHDWTGSVDENPCWGKSVVVFVSQRPCFFYTAWRTMIKLFYRTLVDFCSSAHKYHFLCSEWTFCGSHHGCCEKCTFSIICLPRITDEWLLRKHEYSLCFIKLYLLLLHRGIHGRFRKTQLLANEVGRVFNA